MQVAFDHACVLAGVNFQQSVENLRKEIQLTNPNLLRRELDSWIERCVRDGNANFIACMIYLLAESDSIAMACDVGQSVIDQGYDEDLVVIALADILHRLPRENKSYLDLIVRHYNAERSDNYCIKLADFYFDAGLGTYTEYLCRGWIQSGRPGMRARLAEHWCTTRNWRSVRELLGDALDARALGAYAVYMFGRSAAALLSEEEVIRSFEILSSMAEPGPAYAKILFEVWRWRIAEVDGPATSLPSGPFPPVVQLDLVQIREAPSTTRSARDEVGPSWISSRACRPAVDALVIGMQRSATSWLWSHLSNHPDVHQLKFKEPVFFTDPFTSSKGFPRDLLRGDFDETSERYWEGPTRNIYRYFNLFKGGNICRIDASPTYAELPEDSVRTIRNILGGQLRIILCVRDPVERTWSNLRYHDLLASPKAALTYTFEQRVALYTSVESKRRCDYGVVVRAWRRYFDHLHVIFHDDVIARPAEVIAAVQAFLGLTPRASQDISARINLSLEVAMPREDRSFLFGLHQSTYDDVEVELGGPAKLWRARQIELLSS